ncbi:hypothetical protein ABI59_05730 [Acidobacteria bacterium Mor1]|nr:hypothetical protein ABI59_05730 [Acidobacteria bacterium Mor1]
MEEVRRAIRSAAPYRVPVLIRGPSGSGKERVARALHRLSGRPGAFVAVNCCALPEALLEAELFGAVRGAYTGIDRDRRGLFRRAEKGTLLLDEIGDMPPGMQAKLLRVLQEGAVRPVGADTEVPVDVRILSATHRELDAAAARGRFRADLLYRIRMLPIDLPPLAERVEDLPELCRALIGDLAKRHGLSPGAPDQRALQRLRRHSWPGNVRELEAVLVRGLLAAGGGDIREEHLLLDDEAASACGSRLEREMIEQALEATRHNLTRAARRIGWSRQKLYRRIESLGVARNPDADRGS